MRSLSVAAVLLSVLLVPALAQDYSPPKQIKDLGWMVGAWSGNRKITFGGHSAEITTEMTISFDGQFLKEISTDKSAGSTLTKTTMTGWDPEKSQYISYTFTNMAPTARIAHGKIDGGKLSMVSDPWEAEGFKMVGRETMSKVSDTKCNLVMELKQGDKWLKEMDFILEKK
ncbi:MAG TPA: DUF1579 family protein [Fimbriimonas sp.]|nr:DUF1579 family protein [Fimbriimonas sp.]